MNPAFLYLVIKPLLSLLVISFLPLHFTTINCLLDILKRKKSVLPESVLTIKLPEEAEDAIAADTEDHWTASANGSTVSNHSTQANYKRTGSKTSHLIICYLYSALKYTCSSIDIINVFVRGWGQGPALPFTVMSPSRNWCS